MGIDIRQSLKLTQQLLMTPQLQQAIKLLQLSRFELEEFISAQLAENPVLEEGQTESAEEQIQREREEESTEAQAMSAQMDEAVNIVNGDESARGDFDEHGERSPVENDLDWEAMSRYNESSLSSGTKTNNKNSDDLPNYENIISKGKTLNDVLEEQMLDFDLDETERKAADLLMGNLDERGYLSISLEELSDQENLSLDVLEDMLDTIQRLDPPGVGARDLKECLLIQIRDGGLKNGIIEKIVEHHLKDLETRNVPGIAKALGVPLNQIIENIQVLLDLEPVPGRPFSSDLAQVIIPDVFVFKLAGEWVVSLNEEGLPKLRISDYYNGYVGDKHNSSKDKNYIQEKMKSASWLIKSIQQRQRTIYRVAESIVQKQLDFFEQGVEHLKPMILKDVAEAIEMHESTISRVTTNKYVHTPRGIFELKYFFSSSVSMSDGGDLASESVKQMINEIVKNEDSRRPYSDQKIVDLLKERKVELARRTVAKYREQLGILPSSRRKKLL